MRAFIIISFFLSLNALAVSAADLVKDGKPAAEFVLPAEPSDAEAYAAMDVRSLIEKMSGARLKILDAPSKDKNTKIHVGTELAGQFKEDLSKLKDNDGYAIRQNGDDIYIFGSRPRGTMYGLYAFLENNTDIIFTRPNARFGTVYSQYKDMPVKAADTIDIPKFIYRSFGPGYPGHQATGEWQLRNRGGQLGRPFPDFMLDQFVTYGTNFPVPMTKYFPEHPEYFGYNPDTRQRKGVMHGEGTLCLMGKPEIPELWAKGLLELVEAQEKRTGKKVEFVHIGPGDNWYCCRCEECLKPLKLEDGSTLECKDPDSQKDPLFRSTQIFSFLNKAMETWGKLRPDTKVNVLAYIHFAEPPKVKLHPLLGIYFAPYPTNTMHFPLLDPRQHSPWRERFEKWLTMSDNLGFYEYYYSKPNILGFYAAENLRAVLKNKDSKHAAIYSEFDNDRGSRGIGENAFGWDVGLLNTWVIARLFWDPTQDVDKLYEYCIQRTYKEAAPQMTQYYKLLRKSWIEDENDKTVDAAHAAIGPLYDNMIVKKGYEEQMMNILAEAEKAAQNPNSKHLVKRMRERYASFSKGMNRLFVANAPEALTDGGSFSSLQWEKSETLDDFKVTTRIGKVAEPSGYTSIKAMTDGRELLVRFTAEGNTSKQKVLVPVGNTELWPLGDHVELWLAQGNDRYVFAFNSAGALYDAKNLDRNWSSNGKLEVRKDGTKWDAILRIPLETFKLAPKQKTNLQWFATRELTREDGSPEEISYAGKVLYNSFLQTVME